MFSILRNLFGAKSLVRQSADQLRAMYGDTAYFVARDKARESAGFHPRAQRHWNRVAVYIARTTNYTIGQKAADRYFSER